MAKKKQAQRKQRTQAQRKQRAQAQAQRAERLREYVRAHLGEACKDFVGIQDDLLDSQVHPTSSFDCADANSFPMTPARRARLRELRGQKILYIGRIIEDLRYANCE